MAACLCLAFFTCMIISSCIHVAADGVVLFFFMTLQSSIVSSVRPLLYPFLCQWPLGCFRDLSIVNSAAVNFGCLYLFEL